MILKKLAAFLAAASVAISFAGCNQKDKTQDTSFVSVYESNLQELESTEPETDDEEETPTEPATKHISPVENLSSTLGTQVTLNKTIQRTEGSNTCKIPLSDFVEVGDMISSFTFIIYSGDGTNIGTFKGGCGISVTEECTAATDEGWFQSADFSVATEGTYGEIKWDVPSEIKDYISIENGEILLGYWWGNSASVRIDSVVCTYTRTKDIPVDSKVDIQVGQTVGYDDTDNFIKVPFKLSDNDVPQAIIFNVSAGAPFGKFTGGFGISCNEDCDATTSKGWYQSEDIAVFTDSSSLSLTWFVPDDIKKYVLEDGEIMLGYWWSEQPVITLDSITIKYSNENGVSNTSAPQTPVTNNDSKPSESPENSNSEFRSSSEIISSIKIGWNLGNTLECYDYSDWTTNAETAWGNPVTTKEMVQSVKDSGFNAIRIPVTWGEHLSEGNQIDSSWMSRVKEVVDYAYNMDLFVILNVHHDDYVWLKPNQAEYSAMSAKLCEIWTQISNQFKDYGDRLIFEGMNEPRTVGSEMEWNGGTAEERAVINNLEQDFVNTVRASGGNNAKRTLVVTSYAASAVDSAVNDVVVPNDDNVVISFHYYAPWEFADGIATQFDNSDKAELSATFNKLKTKFVDNGTPVIIGEFGCIAAASDSVRSDYYNYYISAAKACGLKCFVWDNGIASGESSFAIFNRNKMSWNSVILQGIINGAV